MKPSTGIARITSRPGTTNQSMRRPPISIAVTSAGPDCHSEGGLRAITEAPANRCRRSSYEGTTGAGPTSLSVIPSASQSGTPRVTFVAVCGWL